MENERQFGEDDVISLGDWIITLLITAIPLVGFIMLLIWAFGGNAPKSKANWAKANLIFMLVAIVLVFIFWGTIVALALGSSGGRY